MDTLKVLKDIYDKLIDEPFIEPFRESAVEINEKIDSLANEADKSKSAEFRRVAEGVGAYTSGTWNALFGIVGNLTPDIIEKPVKGAIEGVVGGAVNVYNKGIDKLAQVTPETELEKTVANITKDDIVKGLGYGTLAVLDVLPTGGIRKGIERDVLKAVEKASKKGLKAEDEVQRVIKSKYQDVFHDVLDTDVKELADVAIKEGKSGVQKWVKEYPAKIVQRRKGITDIPKYDSIAPRVEKRIEKEFTAQPLIKQEIKSAEQTLKENKKLLDVLEQDVKNAKNTYQEIKKLTPKDLTDVPKLNKDFKLPKKVEYDELKKAFKDLSAKLADTSTIRETKTLLKKNDLQLPDTFVKRIAKSNNKQDIYKTIANSKPGKTQLNTARTIKEITRLRGNKSISDRVARLIGTPKATDALVKASDTKSVVKELNKLYKDNSVMLEAINRISKLKDNKKIAEELKKLGVHPAGVDYSKVRSPRGVLKKIEQSVRNMENAIEVAKKLHGISENKLLSELKIDLDDVISGSKSLNTFRSAKAKYLRNIENTINNLHGELGKNKIAQEALSELFAIKKYDAETKQIVYKKGLQEIDVPKIIDKYKKNIPNIENIVVENNIKLGDIITMKRVDGQLRALVTKQISEMSTANYKPTVIVDEYSRLSKYKEFGVSVYEGFVLPALWFKVKGLKHIFYNPIRKAEEMAQYEHNEYIKKLTEKGVGRVSTVNKGYFVFDLGTKNPLKKKRLWKEITYYFAGRQGYDTPQNMTYDMLTKEQKKVVDAIDEVLKDVAPKFFDASRSDASVASRISSIDKLIDNYAPLYTKKEAQLYLMERRGEEVADTLFGNRFENTIGSTAFSSKKTRQSKKFDPKIYETNYELVFNQFLKGSTKYIHMQPTILQTGALFEHLAKEQHLTDRDKEYIKNFLTDVSIGKKLSPVERFAMHVKGVAGVYVLGLKATTVAKQFLTPVAHAIMEGVVPKWKSEFLEKAKLTEDDIMAIVNRRADADLNAIKDKVSLAMVYPLTQADRWSYKGSWKAFADKELKQWKQFGAELDDDLVEYIINYATEKADMYYGGITASQMPVTYRNTFGATMYMFTKPLNSQFNAIVYQVAKYKGLPHKQALMASKAFSALATIAYLEQSIQHWSFQWDSEEAMIKDVSFGILGNIAPIAPVNFLIEGTYDMATTGSKRAFEKSSGVAIADISKTAIRLAFSLMNDNKDDVEKYSEFGKSMAFMLGMVSGITIPEQVFDYVVGAKFAESGEINVGTSDNPKILKISYADRVRSFINGKYGSLALLDYVKNIGIKKDKRHYNIKEVEFLNNADKYRRFEIYQTLPKDERKDLLEQLPDADKKELKKLFIAQKFGIVGKTKLKKIYVANDMPVEYISKDEYAKYLIRVVASQNKRKDLYNKFNDIDRNLKSMRTDGMKTIDALRDDIKTLDAELTQYGMKKGAFAKYFNEKANNYYITYLANKALELDIDIKDIDGYVNAQPKPFRKKLRKKLLKILK